MKFILAAIMFLSSSVGFAGPIVGGPVKHTLYCTNNTGLVGVSYKIEVTTQAVAPQHSVRGISVLTQVVAPNAPVNEAVLQEVEQDEYFTIFGDDTYSVSFYKDDFTAELYINAQHEFDCAKSL